jgi:hypothetical protein
MPTLVAITTPFRFAPRFNQFPRIVSDSPPRCPGTHTEYTFAVSAKGGGDRSKMVPCDHCHQRTQWQYFEFDDRCVIAVFRVVGGVRNCREAWDVSSDRV